MTKKDYINIAKVLKDARPERRDISDFGEFVQAVCRWGIIVHNMSEMFKEDNTLFNVDKFLSAVGID